MVEKRGKFAALRDLHQAEPEGAEHEALAVRETEKPPVESAVMDAGKGRGRPATGKRSNPDFKLYSHYLKRKTQRAAVAKLLAEDGERDLSGVIQELLENWLKS